MLTYNWSRLWEIAILPLSLWNHRIVPCGWMTLLQARYIAIVSFLLKVHCYLCNLSYSKRVVRILLIIIRILVIEKLWAFVKWFDIAASRVLSASNDFISAEQPIPETKQQSRYWHELSHAKVYTPEQWWLPIIQDFAFLKILIYLIS